MMSIRMMVLRHVQIEYTNAAVSTGSYESVLLITGVYLIRLVHHSYTLIDTYVLSILDII